MIKPKTENRQPTSRLKDFYRKADKGILALCLVFVVTLPLFTARIYASDEIQYFSYLHSVVFDFDVDFTNEYQHFIALDPPKYEGFKKDLLDKKNENNLPINVAPIGSALLWSPFYLVAHGISSAGSAVGIKAFNPNGYSPFYIFAVTFASLLYGFAGLILAYMLARNFVSKFWAAFGCIVIWLASPLIFYMSLTPPMSHANSLFAISLWLYVWYRTKGWKIEDGKFIAGQRSLKSWFILGLLGALAAMVREQDGSVMIVGAIEAFYCYWQWLRRKNWLEVRRLFIGNVLLLAGLVIGLVPQLLVYQFLNGHPTPSTIVGNKLRFFSPQLFGLMFDFNHGMFWWAPILIPAIVGLILMLFNRSLRFIGIALLAAFVAELYISASFQTWTMAGSYGARRMVGISAAYIIGLGYLGWWLAECKPRRFLNRKVVLAIGALFILWNFGVIFQFSVLRDQTTRQNLQPDKVVADMFTKVPGKIFETAGKFFSNRSDFYRK